MYSEKRVSENLRREKKKLEDKLETVREFILSRRDDIEKDIEDFGMLKPVLNHFIEEAEG